LGHRFESKDVLLLVSEFGFETVGQYCYADSFYRIFAEELGFTRNIIVKKFDCKKKYISRFFQAVPLLNYILRKFDDIFINLLLLVYVRFCIKPKFIFFIKAENINYRVIRYFKQRLSAVVSRMFIFYPDSPFSFFNGNSNKNILMSLPYYDIFFIWSKKYVPILRGAGSPKVECFPFYPELALFQNGKVVPLEDRKYEVSFVGAWDEKRELYLSYLVEKKPQIKLCIVGPLWREKLPKNSLLRGKFVSDALTFTGMLQVFRNSKIGLNFLKEQNVHSHNMRTFEVPCAGSFLLAEHSDEQNAFFESEKEADYFVSKEQLVEKINFYCDNLCKLHKLIDAGCQKSRNYSLKTLLTEQTLLFSK
jgi:hypothetical protein